ncbi:PEP-CTERM-box response regulator transcription factor [Azospirillaceae bacterium]
MNTNAKRKVLIVEDDVGLRTQMKWALADFEVFTAGDRETALRLFDKEQPPVMVLDLGLPPDPNGAAEGLATLEAVLIRAPLTKVVVASGNEERENALKAVSLGAYDFYPKPVNPELLLLILNRAVYLYDLEEENTQLIKQSSRPLGRIITSSPKMLQNCRMVERVAGANVAVLITGESGTGKEMFACGVHDCSPRADKPFIAINSAAIPENLLESELFGHEKGSFTGAVKQTIGKVEQAHLGTLFLDEIGDMPLNLQAKLLRFLQNRTIERIGGRKPIEVDVRVVSATNRDLVTMIRDGSFREDLYYRLNEVSIHIPPLSERPGDAVLLARHFLTRYTKEFSRPVKGFSSDALKTISTYAWPGNVRELENRIKRAVLMADSKLVASADLDLPQEEKNSSPILTLRQAREKAQNEAVAYAMALTNNNISEAAQLLNVSRPTLYDILRGMSPKK